MPDSPVRVALLARPGEARDQLRRALADFGAEIVAEGDPNELEPAVVADGRPGIVVVSLEPAIEDALERFDELLGAHDVEVIYDDAEVTRQLDGWDLARWARHLAAKLAGGDVLPPPREGLDPVPEFEFDLQPGAPQTPAQQMDAEKLEDYAAESLELSDWVPANPSLAAIVVETEDAAPAQAGDDAASDLDLDLDLAGLEHAMAAPAEGVGGGPALASALEASGTDIPQQLGADAPLDFAAADAPLDFAAADAPLDFAGAGEAPLDFADADAPLEFDDTDQAAGNVGDDALLEFDGFDDAVTPVDPAPEPAPLDFAVEDAPLEFAGQDGPLAFAGNDAPLDFDDTGLPPPDGAGDDDLDLGAMDTLDLELDVDLSSLDAGSTAAESDDAAATDAGTDDATADESLIAGMALTDGPVKFSNFASDEGDVVASEAGMDDDVAALAAQLEAFEATDQRGVAREPDFATLPTEPVPAEAKEDRRAGAPAPPPSTASSTGTGGSLFASLELVPMDADVGKMAAADGVTPPSPSLAAGPDVRRSAMSLADEGETANIQAVPGALLVVAGLGGPDGVRQLLSALPPTLPVPVLLYQHLDTGKHERLVSQLAKASRLPLDLAVEGKLAFAGRVAVLQPGIGIVWREDHIEFIRTDGLASLVSQLPASDSIVLVLSGADAAIVPAVLAMGTAGGLMLAQDPGSCFDPAAPQAVIAAGGATAALPELARKIVERWT